jgi:DNA-binding transcriptional LysR family regulator
MHWDDLEAFIAVAELGSFTQAAERLARPKSGVSRSVSLLEKRFGERLMERNTRSLRLTDAGSELLSQVRPLFSQLHDIVNERESFHGQARGILRIASTYEFATLTLADILPDILTEFPDIEATVDLVTRPPDPISDGYDVVFWQSLVPLPDSSIVARRMFEVAFGLYAAPALVKKLGLPDSIEDLRDWKTVSANSNQIWHFTHAQNGTVHKWQTRGRLATPSAQVRLQAAEKAVGVAVLPTMICDDAVKGRRLVRLLPQYIPTPLTVYALMPSRRMLAPRIRILLDAIARRFDG